MPTAKEIWGGDIQITELKCQLPKKFEGGFGVKVGTLKMIWKCMKKLKIFQPLSSECMHVYYVPDRGYIWFAQVD